MIVGVNNILCVHKVKVIMSKALDALCTVVANNEALNCASEPENPACDLSSILTILEDVCKISGFSETTVCQTIDQGSALNDLKDLMKNTGEDSNPLGVFCEGYDAYREADKDKAVVNSDAEKVGSAVGNVITDIGNLL